MEPSLESLRLTELSKSQVDETSSSKQRVDIKKKASKGKLKLNEHPIKYMITLHKNGEDLPEEEPEKVSDEEDEDEPMDYDEEDEEIDEEDADDEIDEEDADDEIDEDAADAEEDDEIDEDAADAEQGGADETDEDDSDDSDAEGGDADETAEDAAENPPPEVEEIAEAAAEIAEVAEPNPPVEEAKVSKGKEVMVEEEKLDEEEKAPESSKIRKFISGRQLLRRLKEGLFGRTEDLAEHLPKIIESNLKYEVDIPKDDDFHIRDYPGECDKLLVGVVPAIWIFNDYGDRFPLMYEIAMSGVEFALESYNNENGSHYEHVSIEKVNMKAGDLEESKYFSDFFIYSLNFTANDVVLGNQTFRVKMERYSHDDTPWFIIYCKAKAKKVKSREK